MKAATGELNLTVITIVAIGAVIAFFTAFLWPNIQRNIEEGWDDIDQNRPDVDEAIVVPSTGVEFTSGNYTMSVK